MSFWEKMQKDARKNIQDGIATLKEGGTTVSRKIEWLTEEGKKILRHRSMDVEPTFGQMKLGILSQNPFLVKGQRKAGGEFGLVSGYEIFGQRGTAARPAYL